jgi:hypothetical protein
MAQWEREGERLKLRDPGSVTAREEARAEEANTARILTTLVVRDCFPGRWLVPKWIRLVPSAVV